MEDLTLCDVYSCIYATKEKIPPNRWEDIRNIRLKAENNLIKPIDAICLIMAIVKETE